MPTLPADADYITISQLVRPPTVAASQSTEAERARKRADPFAFGQRFLEEGDDIFEHNAWDHVEVDEDYKAYAELQYAKQRDSPVSDFDKNRYNSNPARYWDRFYKDHNANFFKNRKWLRQEFPVLADITRQGAGRKVVLEVGAGAGNTAFPLIINNENEDFMVHACDFSKNAVQVMRKSEHYNEKYMRAHVWDVAGEGEDSLPPGLEEESVDVIVLVFIFSALAPNQWNNAVKNLYRLLKPGGDILFRDYGRGDLAQVRFKKGRYLDENFYARGDGTRVYFFTQEELEDIWGRWTPEKGLQLREESQEAKEEATASADEASKGAFDILNIGIDRRLIVNRQLKLKMYRCWMQARFRKRVRSEEQCASTQDENHRAS
jgi:tRNAThr (cytosine32-N3)-methyltransferase